MAGSQTAAAMSTRPGALSGGRRFAFVRAWRARCTVGVVRVAAAPNSLERARIGFSITGVRTAVDRNRLRRRLRAAVQSPLSKHAGLDFVVTTGFAAADVPYSALNSDTNRAIETVADLVTRRLGEKATHK